MSLFKSATVEELEQNIKDLKSELAHSERNVKEYKQSLENERRVSKIKEEDVARKHTHDIEDQKRECDTLLKEQAFEMKHFKDTELKKAADEVAKAKEELAVTKKENEFLHKIVDTNAAIIDVKDVLNKLINKLPNIDIKGLTVQNTNSNNSNN